MAVAGRARARHVLVETTFPSKPNGGAEQFAARAVEARLAACVSLVPGVRSVYWWKGAVERDDEVLVSFKSSSARASQLVRWIRREHPHDVPYVATFPLKVRNAAYAQWLDAEAGLKHSGRVRRRR